jgi:hypothetical protein
MLCHCGILQHLIQVALNLKRIYGPVACVEALWRLNGPDSAQGNNRSFWLAVLDRLGIVGLGKVKLSPEIVAGFYAAHLDDPVAEASVRVLEAANDGDSRKEHFWSAVLNAILFSRSASNADWVSPGPYNGRVQTRAGAS